MANKKTIPVECALLAFQPYVFWPKDITIRQQGIPNWTGLIRSPIMTTRCHYHGDESHMSDVWGPGLGRRDGEGKRVQMAELYSEVQCIMGNGHMGTHLWTDRQIWVKTTLLAGSNNKGTLLTTYWIKTDKHTLGSTS